MSTWTPIDSRRTMTAADAELHAQLDAAHGALGRLLTEWPALMHLLRDHQADGIQGHTTDELERRGPRLWCWDHEQELDRCQADGWTDCLGEPMAGPSDPVGTAGTTHDRAATDQRAMRRDAHTLATLIGRMTNRANQYPGHTLTPEGIEPQPGIDICACCWKDNKAKSEIERRSDGTAYYKGLCRTCGRWKKELGDEPPVWLLRKIRRKERIYDHEIEKARAQIRARVDKRKPKR